MIFLTLDENPDFSALRESDTCSDDTALATSPVVWRLEPFILVQLPQSFEALQMVVLQDGQPGVVEIFLEHGQSASRF